MWRRKPVELLGREPPQWFIDQSDGGSTPLGRFGKILFHEHRWVRGAWRHDFRYYMLGLQWRGPDGDKPPEPAWVGERHEADYEFKINRRRCARKNFMAPIRAMYCYRAVRVGGRGSVRKPNELAVPPTMADIGEIETRCQFPITDQAQTQITKWRRMLAD